MEGAAPRWCGPAVVLAALVGLGLMADSLRQSSATYDEVAYLRVAARWWRTGDQDEITRMGSPLTFWKLQQVPVLWALDRIGSSRDGRSTRSSTSRRSCRSSGSGRS